MSVEAAAGSSGDARRQCPAVHRSHTAEISAISTLTS